MKVTLIPGDGIGPEISAAACRILEATGAPLEWERRLLGLEAEKQLGTLVPPATMNSIRANGLCFKGPLTTPIGDGFKSMNVMLRQAFMLYANIRPAASFAGIKSPYQDINIVLFRENVEGEYAGTEYYHGDNNVDGQERYSKIDKSVAYMQYHVTREGCRRIIRSAFAYAKTNHRWKVTLAHKANIMKLTQGMMVEEAYDIAALYPGIKFEPLIIDNCCQQLVLHPNHFDVIVTSNMFGDILGDLNAALVGGVGLTGSANIGDDCAMFEAVHGSAPDIAGKGVANPTSMTLAGTMMLRHLGMRNEAMWVEEAIRSVIAGGLDTTQDIGGKGNTESFTDRVVQVVKQMKRLAE